jgi:hypothetical protein
MSANAASFSADIRLTWFGGGHPDGRIFLRVQFSNWTIGVAPRIQSGRLLDLGNVRLVGMTASGVQDMFKLRLDNAGRKIWMFPQDVIDDAINAFSVTSRSGRGSSATRASKSASKRLMRSTRRTSSRWPASPTRTRQTPTTMACSISSGAAINNYEVTALTGTNTSRILQIVSRFNC